MKFEIVYVILLFIVYRTVFHMVDLSINTAMYGLFAILLFFYYLTDNLNFNKKAKYKSVYVNAVIFLIFLFFYKNPYIFVAFLLFSIFQIVIQRLFKKLHMDKEKRYNPSLVNIRGGVKLLLDTGSVCAAIVLSFMMKYDTDWMKYIKKDYFFIYLSIFLLGYVFKKISEKSWSYTNILDVFNLLCLNIFTAAVFTIFVLFQKTGSYPWVILFMIMLISVSLQLFGRYLFRLNRYYAGTKRKGKVIKRALIYGAGEAGAILARESFTSPTFPYKIVGFIDDDFKKVGTEIYKVKVLGTMKAIQKIIENEKIDEILLALPSIKGEQIRSIVEKIQGIENIKIKTVPGIPEILEDRELATQLRSVKIEDLLGRDEISINDSNIRSLIEGKTIFVTGGAGSIGSELARQIAKFNPRQLVAIDVNENDIYFLELELHRLYPNLNYVSEICNIREKDKLEFLFNKYKPNIVFHAAAHKHVPLMEHNPEEAIKNNIFGTKNVAECADKYGVQRMVLISTDKAVNPTNLMGASKRACELVIEHMNRVSKNTKFMAVRFGNVLGSHGSVIPIFRNLIEQGKNLTVTHRDITRYFMTIPEAAQLVIEAGSIGEGGEIFILDMGKPVKIYELAQSMIKLSNANVGIDIVGLRPGEKLYEELLYDVNNAIKTENKKIFITKIQGHTDITKFYEELMKVTNNPDIDKIKELMKRVIVTYREADYK
ncbi:MULTISPECIES: nucleoside-diphosphate sugar epimerase/dehydratase [unclassified Fusobacterium]|uniref:polysaccharide biosynthesis protein n=1 Tax=unclassified Fusobacterium TaxID=2648384 RepID=UPI001B8C7E6E|nr:MULTISPECIES: nucleoside-diphosphate sugar epimerase/dehydratase [unclassified Fusobacterium]MBR8700679.1 GDP-L-fucose synthase [Fusobacterium sp. DD45]MBR8710770.1 GDP-L-fucose synthase [Fusobacterium sp. DD28]MBR8751378.1 GDP-L-fucose synthase [Fusobacterium sp. DD26]